MKVRLHLLSTTTGHNRRGTAVGTTGLDGTITEDMRPKVGRPFEMLWAAGLYHTTTVEEVNRLETIPPSDRFITKNSFYRLEYLDA